MNWIQPSEDQEAAQVQRDARRLAEIVLATGKRGNAVLLCNKEFEKRGAEAKYRTPYDVIQKDMICLAAAKIIEAAWSKADLARR